jgi:hypothetical protein
VEGEVRHDERLSRALDDVLLVVRLGVLPDEGVAVAVGDQVVIGQVIDAAVDGLLA